MENHDKEIRKKWICSPECCVGLLELDTVAVVNPIAVDVCCDVVCGTPTPGGGCNGCVVVLSVLCVFDIAVPPSVL